MKTNKKYRFKLNVIIQEDFILTGMDYDDVEQQAIEIFKKNNPTIKVEDYFGENFKEFKEV